VRSAALKVLVLVAALAIPAQTSAKDVTKLFDQAVQKVRANPDFADAVVLEADGLPAGKGAIERASQIGRWRFVFDNSTPGSDSASVTIDWKRGEGFSKPDGNPSPLLDDVEIRKAPKMTLREAVNLLEAGGTKQFDNVTLRRPLGPESTPPLYIFGLASGKFVAVNTKTGDVEPIG
jgi:hypothetical protein